MNKLVREYLLRNINVFIVCLFFCQCVRGPGDESSSPNLNLIIPISGWDGGEADRHQPKFRQQTQTIRINGSGPLVQMVMVHWSSQLVKVVLVH